jgi:tetratricopeptide (TPR) repeat protein
VRSDLAFGALGKALREDTTHPTTLGELERLADVVGTWEPLVKVLREVASGRLDLPRQIDVRCRLARLYQKLGQTDRAITTFARVLDLDGNNLQAMAALEKLYEATGQHRELVDVLRKQMAITDDTQQLIALEFRCAQLFETHLNDLSTAMNMYTQIIERDPKHAPTLARLAELTSDGERGLELWQRVLEANPNDRNALSKLAKIFEERANWPGLIEMLSRQLKLAETDDEKLALLRRLAETARATSVWETLSSALEAILAMASALKRDEVLALSEELARLETDILLRKGQAIAAWQRVLALDETHGEALIALERLYLHESRWQE